MPNWGESDGRLEKPIKALNDKVCLRKIEKYHERSYGKIFVPISADINARMNSGVVVSIGPKAKIDLFGLNIGDVVLYDHFGACADTHPYVVVPAQNIICKVEDNEKTTRDS